MKYSKLIFSLCLLIALSSLIACKKYSDPSATDLGLTNKYCNDPIAANFNWGFPGVPDNSVCVYATDTFSGAWTYIDSVFLPDLSFYSTQAYNLNFVPKGIAVDTYRNQMTVSGFCNASILELKANKYNLALTDTLIPGSQGQQLFCQSTDTISGSFKVLTDSTGTRMQIYLTELNPNGTFIHTGKAIRQ